MRKKRKQTISLPTPKRRNPLHRELAMRGHSVHVEQKKAKRQAAKKAIRREIGYQSVVVATAL